MQTLKQKFTILIASFYVVLSLGFCLLPLPAQARGLVPCGGYADNAGTTREPVCDVRYIFILIATLTNWLISVAGIYAVWQIVNAGFNLVTSMGNEEKINKYKTAISNAVVGFVFVMLSFIFINTALNYILIGISSESDQLRVDFTQPLCYLNASATGCVKTSSSK